MGRLARSLPPEKRLSGPSNRGFSTSPQRGIDQDLPRIGDARRTLAGDDMPLRGVDTGNMLDMTSPSRTRPEYPASTWQRLTDPLLTAGTYAMWGYLLLGLVTGVTWLAILLALYLAGLGLVVVWIGLPLLASAQYVSRLIGLTERWLAVRMLGADITFPAPPGGSGLVERGRRLLTDAFAWRSFAWAWLRVVLGPIGFALAVVAAVVPIALVVAPVG